MMDCLDKNDKYRLVKAKGGMGNRMLCAVTGIIYGQLTGRKTVVDWCDMTYSNDGSNSFSRFFSNPSVYPETILPERGTVRPSIWKNHLHKSMNQMLEQFDPDKHSSIRIHKKYSIDVRRLDFQEDVAVFWNYNHCIGHLLRHLRGMNYPFAGLTVNQIIRRMLHEQLSLKENIKKKIANFKASHWP
jgi:hypothetical protein